MNLGGVEVAPVPDGFFKLDGGAMFGIIPKPLWERRIPADDRNRIRLGLNPLLVRTADTLVLIDTGIGTKFDAKSTDIYEIRPEPGLHASLAAQGVTAEDVDVVIITHLHFDHCGGNTRLEDDEPVPAFPRARYVVQEREWKYALNPDLRSRGSYRAENVEPIRSQVDLVEGEVEVVPGVRCLPTPGHTEHHQSVMVQGTEQTVVYLGDLIPTAAHLDLPYVMGYDLFPRLTVETKSVLLYEVVKEGWLVAFEHDPALTLARVTTDGKRYRAEAAEGP